jgi:hypothetical protein
MKAAISQLVYGAIAALLMVGQAQSEAPAPARVDVPRLQEEIVCIGPGSITGTAVTATTIVTPHFSAYKCFSHGPMPITVQFKDPSAALKVGDTVKLTGRLIYVLDERRSRYGFVLRSAEIVQ